MKYSTIVTLIIAGTIGGVAGLNLAEAENDAPPLSATTSTQDRFMNSDLGDNFYSVTFVNRNNSSAESSRKEAVNYAARIAEEKGYRYFTIESEENVRIVQSEKFNPEPPVNLYQELIVEKNYGRDPVNQERPSQSTQVYPATKLVIKGYYSQAPRGAYDVRFMNH
jgi:hypothetical protein